jgi:hypothetical protein
MMIMERLDRARRPVDRLVTAARARPPWMWALWGVALAVVLVCPAVLADPALWFYLVDPELLALMILVGVQMAWPVVPAYVRSALRVRRRRS